MDCAYEMPRLVLGLEVFFFFVVAQNENTEKVINMKNGRIGWFNINCLFVASAIQRPVLHDVVLHELDDIVLSPLFPEPTRDKQMPTALWNIYGEHTKLSWQGIHDRWAIKCFRPE